MSSQMFDFDDFEFEPEDEHDPANEAAFSPTPGMVPSNTNKEGNEEFRSRTPAPPRKLDRQAAQAAYQAAQQTTSVIPQPAESSRPAWSAALAEEVALLETLAATASRATNLAEALALVAALPVVALRLTPHSYRALWPLLPALIQGTQGVAQVLYGRSHTRPLINLLPAILENSVSQLADQVALDRPVTPASAAKALAYHTGQLLQQQERQTIVAPESGIRQRNGHGYRA